MRMTKKKNEVMRNKQKIMKNEQKNGRKRCSDYTSLFYIKLAYNHTFHYNTRETLSITLIY